MEFNGSSIFKSKHGYVWPKLVPFLELNVKSGKIARKVVKTSRSGKNVNCMYLTQYKKKFFLVKNTFRKSEGDLSTNPDENLDILKLSSIQYSELAHKFRDHNLQTANMVS